MRALKTLAYLFGAGMSLLYLLNPTAGLLELVPDNLPLVGHVDEAAAMGILIASVRGLRRLGRRQRPPPP